MADTIFPLGLAGLTYRQTADCFPVGTDAVLLSAFARVHARAKVCDLGCAGGILPLLLCGRHPRISVTGVEISGPAALAARENVARNGLDGRISIVHADFRAVSLPAEHFDSVVCNPPYYAEHSGRLAKKAAQRAARAELSCTIDEVCTAATRLLHCGGTFFCVYKPARLCALLSAMEAARLTPKRLRFVLHKQGTAPVLALVEGKKGAAAGLLTPPALVLRKSTGAYTAEAHQIYHPAE